MPARPLDPKILDEAVAAVRKHGSLAAAARALGLTRPTLEHRYREAQRRSRIPTKEENLRRDIFRLSEVKLEPPRWTVPGKKTAHTDVVPILFASDIHWGERISPEELDGVNGYSPEIARQRLHRLFETTIQICRDAMSPKYRYPGIVYARGGDMISGDIHQELRESNSLSSIPAVMDIAKYEIAGIKLLLEAFGRVHVVSVPGNHGRQTEKPMHKRVVETNYDTLLAYMIESHFRAIGEDRVTFCTPESGDAVFAVCGWQFLMTHGDRIGSRGGEGFIGPVATISRGMKKTFDFYASLRKRIDYMLIGHFHTSLKLEYGFANGCLSGFSEYARSFRMRPTRPSQWLLLVNQPHGVFAPFEVFLEDSPMLGEAESLPWV